MKILQWENDFKSRTTGQLKELRAALDTLLEWETFSRTYRHMGFDQLRELIQFELIQREWNRLKEASK